ncbi:MAG: CDP-glucose 4,6-dehydratase [Pontiellaceae bacterium]|jgi:CDP-glucose 4,6-dehydratase|nr:CDP-glucose 4,6-dehydratase [Pontiellaceae bacterium]
MDRGLEVMFGGVYQGKRVLLTGHTGFKGSWLTFWLQKLGADVCGYALPAATEPSHWMLLNLDVRSELADIRDVQSLEKVFREFRPEMVFHLAAQPLVRASYRDPVETYSTNVMGTLNVLEACRKTESVRAVINVTSDKCYENREWKRGYREDDAMGGFDPYSSSKGCSELLTASYRNSFFNNEKFETTHQTLLASCRAGNVIGGGDWAEDRLIPDIMRAVAAVRPVDIRNPNATRPWQHVLEPLGGYLLVGQRLLEGKPEFATGWNFGPAEEAELSVRDVVENIKRHWDRIDYRLAQVADAPYEAHLLKLDCAKARERLNWHPVWNSAATFEKTVGWYRAFYETGEILTQKDLCAYELGLKK